MSEEVKTEIIRAWNRHLNEHTRRARKNEGSVAQHEDTFRLFKQGIKEHAKLSKKEKEELITHLVSTYHSPSAPQMAAI